MPIVLPTVTESLGAGSALKVLQGTGKSVPSGIDAILSYNGLAMNNRSWLDSIIITKIDGFSDAAVRDEREDNPQDHGETAFDSFYSGRSISLHGFIRAFSLDKLRDIEQGLKSAFLDLSEKPLLIQGKTLDTTVQIWCRKNAEMAWSDEQTRDDMFVRPFMIPLRASNPRFVSLEEQLRLEEFGVNDNFSTDTISADVYKFIEGSKSALAVKEGKLTVTSLANKIFARQDFLQPQPSGQFDYTPKGAFTSSQVGFYLKYIDANNNILVLVTQSGAVGLFVRIEGVTTGKVFSYSLGSSPISRVAGTTYRIKAEMQGNFVWFYHGTVNEWKQIAKYELTFAESLVFGPENYTRTYAILTPGSLEWTYDNLAFGSAVMSDQQVMTLINNGNFEAEPVYEIVGPVVNPAIHNADTDESLLFKPGTSISAGDVWTIDIKGKTLTDIAGDSKFGRLDPLSDWPQLIGGENHLRFSGEEMSPSVSESAGVVPGLVIRYRHTWM